MSDIILDSRANPCDLQPCSNEGKCLQRGDFNDFYCECPSPFYGRVCQYKGNVMHLIYLVSRSKQRDHVHWRDDGGGSHNGTFFRNLKSEKFFSSYCSLCSWNLSFPSEVVIRYTLSGMYFTMGHWSLAPPPTKKTPNHSPTDHAKAWVVDDLCLRYIE